MNLPRLSLKTLLYFFLLVVVFIFVAEGGYFLGIRQGEKKAVVTEKEKENEIQKYATSSIYYLFGTLTEVGENSWTVQVEESEQELIIKDELTQYPPTYFVTSDNRGVATKAEEIEVGDRVRMEVAITSEDKVDVIALTKLSQ